MSDIKRVNVNGSGSLINPDYDTKLNHTDASLFTADVLKHIAGYNPANGINMQNAVDVLAQKHSSLESKAAYVLDSDSESDLDLSDEDGNVLARFSDGHFQTLNFDSSVIINRVDLLEEVSETHPYIINGYSESDLEISDEDNNAIIEFKEGHIRTKKFDSRDTKLILYDDSDSNFNIGDENGNVIVQFKDGHIKTKKFDSRDIETSTEELNYSYDATSKIILTKPELKFDIKRIIGPQWGNQGFGIYGDYAIVLKNNGLNGNVSNNAVCRIYKITDNNGTPTFSAYTDAFLLDSYEHNHANTISFGNKYDENDYFPLAYIPRVIAGTQYMGCDVERINLNGTSTKVQEISIGTYRDKVTANSEMQWTTDGKYLYMFGYTGSSYSAANNSLVFCKLELPDPTAGDVSVNLNNALEFYYFEDYGFHNTNVMQGCKIINNMMVLPNGFGSSSGRTKSHLLFWDINQRHLKADLDLSALTSGEFEDVEYYKDSLLIYVGGGSMYQMKF